MVMAKLHVICGNCGCNDMWEWHHQPEETDEGVECITITDEDVYLSCRNCSTLHSINDSANKRNSGD